MKDYRKIVGNGYIEGIGVNTGGTKITPAEYETILGMIRNQPTAEDGFGYRLKEDLTWELYRLPVPGEENKEETL